MATDSFAFLLGDASRLIRRRFDARARTLGVSRAQWQVLFALSRNEGINQTGLADWLEVETITLCRMVDRLADAGLVERRPDPSDRRAWRLHLTDAAHPLLDQLKTLGDAVVADAVVDISADDLATTLAVLTAVRTNLSSREPARKKGTA
ncbi:MAG: MarR family transcriptional regulator [Sphingomonadaceae bacterium]|nr:MarR family transcriptional regulator [Sphingomonadaceae bacterium]